MRSGCGRLSFAFVHGRFVTSGTVITHGGERTCSTRPRGRGVGRCLAAIPAAAQAATRSRRGGLTPTGRATPLGLGDARPTLALDPQRRRPQPRAVRLPGRSCPKDDADVWDSGEVHSPASANVAYGGPRSQSGDEVRVEGPRLGRSRPGRAPRARRQRSRPACSRKRRLRPRSGSARPPSDLDLNGDKWIWYTNDDAANNMPALTRFLRATREPARARPAGPPPVHGRRRGRVYVNGTLVADTKPLRDGDKNAWQKRGQIDVTSRSTGGANTIAVQVKNRLDAEQQRTRPEASSPA